MGSDHDQAAGLRGVNPQAHKQLRVIAVFSGKGGVGKTHMAANLAVLAARRGDRVLLMDADLGLANVEILFGIKPKYHLGHVLDGSISVEQAIAPGPSGVGVLPAGSGLPELTHLSDAQKMQVVTALDPLEDRYDVVIIDSGAGIGDNVLFFTGAAQEAVLVLTPEPTSFADAYAALKVVCQRGGMRTFNVIVNQAQGEASARDLFGRLGQIAERFLPVQLKYLGSVPRDENMHRAVMAQKPLVELFPASLATRALTQVGARLFQEAPTAPLDGGMKFLYQRLLREAPSIG
ncbi:MAG: MinD/ParA family protein [Deltaproteobacteria bacterium]|nr:MinD/ParA family protein [Deltaproteobacteria bacterium]